MGLHFLTFKIIIIMLCLGGHNFENEENMTKYGLSLNPCSFVSPFA